MTMTRRVFSIAAVWSAVGSLLGCKTKPTQNVEALAESQQLAHGPLDDVWSTRCYYRKYIAPAMKPIFPGIATCGRCDLPWSLLREHAVFYSESRATFALCEDCWDELQVSEHRIPYYRQVNEMQHQDWLKYKAQYPSDPDPLSEWPALEKAIKAADDPNQMHWFQVPTTPDEPQKPPPGPVS
jgi:hypothetical protein